MNEAGKFVYVWEILASEQDKGWQNIRTHVVARNMERAIALFRGEHADARLHKVERRNFIGKESVIIDPEVAS